MPGIAVGVRIDRFFVAKFMSKPNKLVVGNWKMHGRRDMAVALSAALAARLPAGMDAGVCVPFPYLGPVGDAVAGSTLWLGAQDVCEHEEGAYTGEVSAGMLVDFGCRLVIVGHSERRARQGETSELVAAKASRALAAGLVPIVCVGETLQEREAGRTLEVIALQMAPVLELGADALARMVIAYEPVWAIGTGLSASVEQAVEVHRAIRSSLARLMGEGADKVRILYGGSVKPETAPELFGAPDVDGGLIGGASLKAEDFLAICQAAV